MQPAMAQGPIQGDADGDGVYELDFPDTGSTKVGEASGEAAAGL